MDQSHSSTRAVHASRMHLPFYSAARRLVTCFVALTFVVAACGRSPGDPFGDGGSPDPSVVALVQQAALPITGAAGDYDPLIQLAGDARVVMLGEATHGTHEFYSERVRITQRLIAEKGFSAIAIEGDWPDAYQVNQYVRGLGTLASAEQALASFTAFPRWMWRNEEIRDLVRWLRTYNDARPADQRVGFYGLDVYSLHESASEVLAYLDRADPAAAGRVRTLYQCFEPSRPDAQAYGAATQ